MENGDWNSILQWWIPATNNNNLCSLAQRELCDRKGRDTMGAQDVRQEPEEGYGSIWVWVQRYWVSSSHVKCIFYRTLLNLLSAVRLHSMPSSRSGSPSHRHIDRLMAMATATCLSDRRAAGRHLHMLMARGLRCAWWVTFRTFYDFGFLMVTALVGAVLHCPPSTVHCPMPIPVYGYWFLL